MEFQSRIDIETPYINFQAVEVASQDLQSRFLLKRFPKLSSTGMKTLGCTTYMLFFAWQVIGLVLYSIRAFETTLLAKRTSFQSTHIKTFRYSAQLQLTWLISQIFNTCLVILALTKVPTFLGYSNILRLLVRLPSFWSLISLYGMFILRYILIIGLKNDSGNEIALMLAFIVTEGVHVTFICFLNFTQVNHCRKKLRLLAFSKFNMFVFFLCYFVKFVISSLQLALNIYGIDSEYIVIPSDSFPGLFGVIRKFALIVFYNRMYNFYWEKLFVDNRNILCHHRDYFDQFTESSPLCKDPYQQI